MNKFVVSWLCAIIFLLTACHQEEVMVNSTIYPASTNVSHTIPKDSALSHLNNFLKHFDDSTTRSQDPRAVKSIEVVSHHPQETRTVGVTCDTILYIANFYNNQGYAILAADNRIKEDVLAIVDEGSMTSSTFTASVQNQTNERPIFPGYPTTGPGFFTLQETGNAMYINPNTVNLYNAEFDDTYVGNFKLPDSAQKIRQWHKLPARNPEADGFAISLIYNYAIHQILMPNQNTKDLNDHEGIGGSFRDSVNPILTEYAEWYQDSDLNILYPLRPQFGHIDLVRAPAGCFPLAIAKVMMHLRLPQNSIVYDYLMDWEAMKLDRHGRGKESAAHLLFGISKGCHSIYFGEGTFTLPILATLYMQDIDLKKAERRDYAFSYVQDMLSCGKPVIIYSMPGIDITQSHCWIIDGYKKKRSSSGNQSQELNMVHCDFGWKDKDFNGYYVSDIFKLNNSDNEFDKSDQGYSSDNTHYNNYLHLITF